MSICPYCKGERGAGSCTCNPLLVHPEAVECVNPRLHCYCPKCEARRASNPPIDLSDALKRSIAEHPAAVGCVNPRTARYGGVATMGCAINNPHCGGNGQCVSVHCPRHVPRRNQVITRGEILDALDAAMHARGGNVGDHNDADMELLRALREAFE